MQLADDLGDEGQHVALLHDLLGRESKRLSQSLTHMIDAARCITHQHRLSRRRASDAADEEGR